jgi:hypothetical protein
MVAGMGLAGQSELPDNLVEANDWGTLFEKIQVTN